MKTSRYSVWARRFKNPKREAGESTFDALVRIARSFVGKELIKAHAVKAHDRLVAFRDETVKIVGITKIDEYGESVGNLLFPRVAFIGEFVKEDGERIHFPGYNSTELYETKAGLARDSELMCGGYGKALQFALSGILYHAKHLQNELLSYRFAAEEYAKLGWDSSRIWQDHRCDKLVKTLMPLADYEKIKEVCK